MPSWLASATITSTGTPRVQVAEVRRGRSSHSDSVLSFVAIQSMKRITRNPPISASHSGRKICPASYSACKS